MKNGAPDVASGGSAPRSTSISLAIIIGFILLITLPFLWQPFHVDDAIFLDFAKNQIEHPFQLHIDRYHLLGEDVTDWRDTHAPGLQLYLAAVISLTGSDSEPVTHASCIVFSMIAGVSMFFLARRFTGNALLATLLMIATPVFMTNAHMLMGDLPTTALSLATMALYIYGIDRDDHLLLWLAGIAMTLAIFTGYQALGLVALAPLYALLRRRLTRWALLPLVLPMIAFSAYVVYNLQRYGSLPRFSHRGGLGLGRGFLWDRLQGAMLKVGGVTVFPLALLLAFCIRRLALVLVPLGAALSVALAIHHHGAGELSISGAVLYTIFMTAMIVALGTILVETGRELLALLQGREADTDTAFLGLWLSLGLAATILVLPHASVKYYLPVLAPLVLLFIRELESRITSMRAVRMFAVAALALTLISGTVISIVDYRYASSYRDFAGEIPQRYADAGKVWFIGEWGFRYYLEQEGYRYLTADSTEPAEGDILLEPSLMTADISPQVAERLELIDTQDFNWGFPVRVMNFDANAGYYGSFWGILPYAFTDDPVESFRIYRVGSG